MKKNREKLENLWDSFKYQLDTINILAPEEITNRSSVLRENIDIVNNNLKDLNNPPKYKSYMDKLQKRKNLTLYIDNLKQNKGIDPEKFNEEDFMELSDPEMENLRKNKIFWRNLGQMYNKNFERGIKWEDKVYAISKDIEDREKRVKEEEEIENQNIHLNGSYNNHQYNNSDAEHQREEPEEPKMNINENDFQDYQEEDNQYDVQEQSEQEIKISANDNYYDDYDDENNLIDEEEERELERKNREIEKNIREKEREKQRLEVTI